MPEILKLLLWVTLGSTFGGMARLWMSRAVGRRTGDAFPWGILAVNVCGCFLAGAVAAASEAIPLFRSPASWQCLVIGFLGSYTTVSSFSLQTLALAQAGKLRQAGGNVALSLALCLAAAALGYTAITAITGIGAP
jgi:CrcB protein